MDYETIYKYYCELRDNPHRWIAIDILADEISRCPGLGDGEREELLKTLDEIGDSAAVKRFWDRLKQTEAFRVAAVGWRLDGGRLE